jgi:ABC-type transport system involved in multi-copper enzyme maturation permease subunit
VGIFRKTIYIPIFITTAGIIGIVAGFVGVFLHYSRQGTLREEISIWGHLIYTCTFAAVLVLLAVYFRRSVLVRILVVFGLSVTLFFLHEASFLKERDMMVSYIPYVTLSNKMQLIGLWDEIQRLGHEKDTEMLYPFLGALAILALIPIDRRIKQRKDTSSPKPPI